MTLNDSKDSNVPVGSERSITQHDQSSFLKIHKVNKVAIFVQFLMGINWNWLPMQSILL